MYPIALAKGDELTLRLGNLQWRKSSFPTEQGQGGEMRIAVTGPTGLVGTRLAELPADKFELVELREEDGFNIVDFKKVQQALADEIDAVLHLAAFTDVSAAWQQRWRWDSSCYKVNVLGTRHLAHICAKWGIYLIHVSTDYVFDGEKNKPLTEEDRPNPIEWYGWTKLWAEQEVLASGVQAAILRIGFPFRAHFSGKLDLVRRIIEGLEKENLPSMLVDQTITPTFIDDLAPVVEYFLTHKPEGIYHAVGSSIITPYWLAKLIAVIWGFDPGVVKEGSLENLLKKDPRPRQRYLGLSNAKLLGLGLTMSDLNTALREVKAQQEAMSGED